MIAKLEDGDEFYFRFYDPRVLKTFLPRCDNQHIEEFFGPIKFIFVEGDTKEEAMRYWRENVFLQKKTVSLKHLLDGGKDMFQ